MNRNLLTAGIVACLFVVGAATAWLYLSKQRSTPAAPPQTTPASDAPEHGLRVEIPPDAVMCVRHNIPEVVCPFCDPSLVEKLGHCGGHDVAEALCTRCNPVLITAFKAEGDWCAAHGLPESQCLICQGKSPG
ncbi:MAG: hypothetical protein ACYSTY_09035 [Planctomycetota bacterium]|jgi:hypothetical protein